MNPRTWFEKNKKETTEVAAAAPKKAPKKTNFSHLKGHPENFSVSDVNNLGADYLNFKGEDEGWFHDNQAHAKKLRAYSNDTGKPSDHYDVVYDVLKELVGKKSYGFLYDNIVDVLKLSFKLSDDFFKGNKAGVLSRVQSEITALKVKELTNAVPKVEIVDDSPAPTTPRPRG